MMPDGLSSDALTDWLQDTTEMTFMCLTCGFEADIDLTDTSGDSDGAAETLHTRFDGAHYPNWLTGDGMLSPDEMRDLLEASQ